MRVQRGQTLIEVLVGLAASAVVMAAITVATITALRNTEYTRTQDLATNYAQQAMEIVRNLQQIDYATFQGLSGTYCFAQSCNEVDASAADIGQSCAQISGSRCPGILNVNSQFIRTITFHVGDSAAASCNQTGSTVNIRVDVVVAWNDNRCTDRTNLYCHNVTLSSCFNNIQVVPTP